MPEIEITPEQEERLRDLQEEIARDVVGKYGHVRPSDAVEYLLDRYEVDDDADPGGEGAPADDDGDEQGTDDGDEQGADDGDEEEPGGDDGESDEGDDDRADDDDNGADGDGDAMLDEMMSLLDTHDDKWGESSGDERYAVEMPDGTSEQVRTKDDVKALLFKHYR